MACRIVGGGGAPFSTGETKKSFRYFVLFVAAAAEDLVQKVRDDDSSAWITPSFHNPNSKNIRKLLASSRDFFFQMKAIK